MDVPNRLAHESDLAGALTATFQAAKSNDPRAVDVARIERETQERTAEVIVTVYLLMIASETFFASGSVESQLAAANLRVASAQYAAARSRVVASTLAANIRGELQAVASVAQSPAEATAGVDAILSRARAERIAASEVTAAASQAEIDSANEYEATTGRRLSATWMAESDNRVCPKCLSLAGTRREEWESEHPSGPPAHPACRCWLDWEPPSEN